MRRWGKNAKGEQVFLRDLWPTQKPKSIDVMAACISAPICSSKQYGKRRQQRQRAVE